MKTWISIILFMTAIFGFSESACADSRPDWDGRWHFYKLSPDGKPVWGKTGYSIDIVDGAVKRFWSGCYLLTINDSTVTSTQVRVHVVMPGVDSTITLVKIQPDLAKYYLTEGTLVPKISANDMNPARAGRERFPEHPNSCPDV